MKEISILAEPNEGIVDWNLIVPQQIHSLEGLKPYAGKVVKFTSDWGNTWHYFLIDQMLCDSDGQIAGIKCFSEKRLWNNRWVGASILFTKDSFLADGCFGKAQSFFALASYDEFSDLPFEGVHGSGLLPEEAASKPCRINPYPDIIQKAPLTLIRSEKPTELAISILFGSRFKPVSPIVPQPTSIDSQDRFIWEVKTEADGTFIAKPATEEMQKRIQWKDHLLPEDRRVKMIWWETIPLHALPEMNETKAACVSRSDLKLFLQNILKKMGVKELESDAFAQYWEKTFQCDYDAANAPSLLVELVDENGVAQVAPEMKVESKETKFDLKRFYFRFKPVDAHSEKGISAQAYLDSLKESQFGPNAVIDLGGQVVPSDAVKQRSCESDSQTFVDRFIANHIVG